MGSLQLAPPGKPLSAYAPGQIHCSSQLSHITTAEHRRYEVIFYPSHGHHEEALLSLNAVSTVTLSLPLAGESDTEIRG